MPTAAGRCWTPAGPARSSLLIAEPVRSGQRIHAQGCDLVVTATVNPGAEIIADGNIHVYGPLRGLYAAFRPEAEAAFRPEAEAALWQGFDEPWINMTHPAG